VQESEKSNLRVFDNSYDDIENDTIKSKELFRIQVGENNFDLKYINNFDFENDTIYMITRNNLVKIDCNDLSIKSFRDNTMFYEAVEIENFDYIFDLKKVDYNKYVFVNFNSVVLYDYNIKSTTDIFKQKNIIYSYLDHNYNIICDYDGVKLLNRNLEVIDSVDFEFIDNVFVKSDLGFIYMDSFSGYLTYFYISNNKIIKEKINPISKIEGIPNLDDFYISLITKDYIIGFNYQDRRYIYFIDRDTFKVVKKVFVSNELIPSNEDIQNEEGEPNLKIINKNNFYYVLTLNSNKELILFRIPRSR
jgi:hypothetical protein